MAATVSSVAAGSRSSAAAIRAAYLGLFVASLGWASAFVIGKVVLREMTPLCAAGWRYVAASAMLLPFALRARRDPGRDRGLPRVVAGPAASRVALPLAAMVVAGGVLYPWLFLGALGRTTATNTSLLIALNPVLTLFLTPLVGERLERRRMLGAGIAFVGAVFVISRGEPHKLLALDLNVGDLLALAAAGCWATFNLASRPVVGRIAPSIANLAVYGTGAIALFLLGQSEAPLAQLRAASPLTLVGVFALALLSSVVAGQLFLHGVRAAGVGRAVVFVYLVPVLTALLAALCLDERFAFAQLVGGGAVLCGLYLATRGGPIH